MTALFVASGDHDPSRRHPAFRPQKEIDMSSSTFRMRARGIACVVALVALLAGCSGASSGASTTPGGGQSAIQGVATPSSVSVVTAN